MRIYLLSRSHCCSCVVGSPARRVGDPGTGDWPMWGGTPDRNMVSNMKGLPTRVGRQDQEEREVGRRPRLAELRQRRRRRRHRLRRHQQRRACAIRSRPGDRGVLMAFKRGHRRVPLAAHAREAHLGPRQRLAVPGRRLVAARRGQQALLRQQPRRRVVRRHQGVQRRQRRARSPTRS